MHRKYQRITDLSEARPNSLYTLGPERFTYAMIMCLSDEELTEFYFDNFSGPLANQIISRIIKRLEEKGFTAFRSFLRGVLDMMDEVDFNSYRRLRSHLRRLLPFAKKDFKNHVFKQFIDSHRKADRSIACEAAFDIWSADIESHLWEAWHLWKDEAVLKALIQKGHPVRLLEIAEDAWFEERLSDHTKRELVKVVAAQDLSMVAFVRNENPITYLWLLVLSGEDVPDEDAKSFVMNAKDIQELGFGLYLLGKLKKWSLIDEIATAFYPPDRIAA